MPGIKTEITEIATGLGALGHDLGAALADPPPQMVNVPDATWHDLRHTYDAGDHRTLFTSSWLNGRAFLLARDGLRGRIPVRVEWKGPDRQVEVDPIPADLRIDHVFLVSIKTRSDVLWNRSPATVFLRQPLRTNWYLEVAEAEYRALYRASLLAAQRDRVTPEGQAPPEEQGGLLDGLIDLPADPGRQGGLALETAESDRQGGLRSEQTDPDAGPSGPVGVSSSLADLPSDVGQLTRAQGRLLASALPDRTWPAELDPLYRQMAHRVAVESARLWDRSLPAAIDRERAAWWLLRLAPAPYYLLGATARSAMRIRVDTPWDWRRQWEFVELGITPALGAGQPQVDWTLRSRHRSTGEVRTTEGYVEVRWSHRKFAGFPEAKVQLRSRHEDVPGYTPLT